MRIGSSGNRSEKRPRDEQRLATIGRQGEQHGFLEMLPRVAACLDGGDAAGEVVFGQHHVLGFLAAFRAGDAPRLAVYFGAKNFSPTVPLRIIVRQISRYTLAGSL